MLIACFVGVMPSIDASIAVGAPAPSLCSMNTARGSIPEAFPVGACVDGNTLWLRNTTSLALSVSTEGSVGTPINSPSDFGPAASITRLAVIDPFLLLPGDTMQIPYGSGQVGFRMHTTSATDIYALANALTAFLPGKAGDYAAYAALLAEVDTDFYNYHSCLSGKNWVGQIGCTTGFDWDIGVAVSRAAISVGAATIVGVLLSARTFSEWVEANVTDTGLVAHAPSLILSAGSAAPAPTTSPTTAPNPPPTSPASNPAPTSAPTTSPPSTSPPTTGPPSTAPPATNPTTTTAPATPTHSEATGYGPVHTWSSPDGPSGSAGPILAANTVYQVDCVTTGTPEGPAQDAYWYLISGTADYGSADAFCDEGATTCPGGFGGTPNVDPGVPNC